MRAVFTLLVVFIVLAACTKDETIPSLPEDADHILYFGFTLIDTYWDDPTDTEEKTVYNDEVAPFSNISDILVVDPLDDLVTRMKAMHELNMKAILHLNELFFEVEGTDAPSGTNYRIRTDYQSRWDVFSATNALIDNQDLVQAFYIGEEPTWNGITAVELQMVSDYVKSSLPKIPIMVIEAYPALNDLKVPTSVDWVGFDHYFIKDPKNDATFNSELNILKSKLSAEQKLVLVMDAHYIDFAHGDLGGIALDDMGAVANSYYELAKSESKIIAILGYFWPSGFDADDSVGARHMPDVVKQEYIRIGKEITGK